MVTLDPPDSLCRSTQDLLIILITRHLVRLLRVASHIFVLDAASLAIQVPLLPPLLPTEPPPAPMVHVTLHMLALVAALVAMQAPFCHTSSFYLQCLHPALALAELGYLMAACITSRAVLSLLTSTFP